MSILKILLVLFLFFPGFNSSNELSPKLIINDVVTLYKIHLSISYSVEYKIKLLSSDDTTSIEAECKLLKKLDDTLSKSLIWYYTRHGREVISLFDSSYIINHDKLTILEYGEKDHKKKTVDISLTKNYFLFPEKLLEICMDTLNQLYLEPVMCSDKKIWKLKIKFPDIGEYSDINHNIWIDTDSKVIKEMDLTIKYQGNYQYEHWQLNNITFDSFSVMDPEERIYNLLQNYKLINNRDKDSNNSLLKNLLYHGTQAPSFTGYHYQNRKSVNFKEFKGKLILLDFWYMSCSPCIQSIPRINKLYKKYKNKGFTALGINGWDKYKDSNRLNKFFKYNKIEYPIIFVDRRVDSIYHVNSYPTFYLIDKTGKIVYTQKGHIVNTKVNNNSFIDSLEFYIKKHLNLK